MLAFVISVPGSHDTSTLFSPFCEACRLVGALGAIKEVIDCQKSVLHGSTVFA